jgi:hypothetical protein
MPRQLCRARYHLDQDGIQATEYKHTSIQAQAWHPSNHMYRDSHSTRILSGCRLQSEFIPASAITRSRRSGNGDTRVFQKYGMSQLKSGWLWMPGGARLWMEFIKFHCSNSVNPLLKGQIMEFIIWHSGSGHYTILCIFVLYNLALLFLSLIFYFSFFNRITVIACLYNHDDGPKQHHC